MLNKKIKILICLIFVIILVSIIIILTLGKNLNKEEISSAINETLYDEQTGLYYIKNEETRRNHFSKSK